MIYINCFTRDTSLIVVQIWSSRVIEQFIKSDCRKDLASSVNDMQCAAIQIKVHLPETFASLFC